MSIGTLSWPPQGAAAGAARPHNVGKVVQRQSFWAAVQTKQALHRAGSECARVGGLVACHQEQGVQAVQLLHRRCGREAQASRRGMCRQGGSMVWTGQLSLTAHLNAQHTGLASNKRVRRLQ